MQRRTFLMSAAAPWIASAWAGANDRIRTAVIGMGGRGRDHLNTLAQLDGVEIAAFCDPDQSRLEEATALLEKRGGKRPRLEPDLRRVLEDRSIDAITIATPNHWHALAAIWGCQAGKHVYVEKPVAHEMAAGTAMTLAARQHNRIAQGGTQRRSIPQLRRAIQALHEGVIGEVYMARAIHFQERDSIGFQKPEDPPANLRWDLWLGPAPQQPFHRNLVHYNWHWFWDFGNGELGNNGVHFIDLARWGMRRRLPVRIHSDGGRFGYKDQGQTPNVQLSTYDFADGAQLVCEIRGRHTNTEAGQAQGVFFYGANGYMSIGPEVDVVPQVFLGKSKTPDPAFAKTMAEGRINMDRLHFQSFFDAIRSGKRDSLPAEIEETRLSTAFCLLGNIAYRLGRVLRFDPEREQFPGDEEAGRMLGSGYRAPFNYSA